MRIAYLHQYPGSETPADISRIATQVSAEATRTGTRHSVFIRVEPRASSPHTKMVPRGLGSDAAIAHIRKSMGSDEHTFLVGSPHEIAAAIVRLGIKVHGAIDYSVPVASATIMLKTLAA